jgi:DegV family protein with EDD domain
MAVRIITDSACDMSQDMAKKLKIKVLPITVLFGETEYKDGVTMSHTEFFEKLIESDVMPTTCQITPYEYEEAFKAVRAMGDTAVCITLSSKLSGCHQSATIAAEDFSDCVTVVDSENVCIGQQILVLLADRLRNEGKSAKEIADILNVEKKKVNVIALLDTLEYLKKGGRISSATAFAGSLLSIKPVVAVKDGEVSLVGKARGSKNGNNLLMKFVEESGGINFDKPYSLAYSGLSDALLKKYIADSEKLYSDIVEELPVCTIGSTIGTHVGPGAIAVAFFSN